MGTSIEVDSRQHCPARDHELGAIEERHSCGVRDGVRSGELRSTDPEKTAFILWATADALFVQKQFRYEELLPTYVGIVRDGLRNPEGPGTEVRESRRTAKSKDRK
ncbi:MAG: hypothetical protein JO121_00135 [Deltaproteobacteria bacterium]|nr:hypothetical protein [Deltaproteobacteria bacterium]